jgi:crotonobetainyl-CoA:carnitine CoA-transferase CaiB-like acyl-CoA transferase
MAEITRPRPLAGVRLIDRAAVVMDPCAAQIFDDLGADVIKLEAVEKTSGSYPYADLSEKRDRSSSRC